MQMYLLQAKLQFHQPLKIKSCKLLHAMLFKVLGLRALYFEFIAGDNRHLLIQLYFKTIAKIAEM